MKMILVKDKKLIKNVCLLPIYMECIQVLLIVLNLSNFSIIYYSYNSITLDSVLNQSCLYIAVYKITY